MVELTRILHIDDDEDIRTIANMALEMVGQFEVLHCASGQEALKVAGEFGPDLLLLDYMMPNMNGEETLAALREIPGLEYVPVVFMTARVQSDVTEMLLRKGALVVVHKPFDPIKLAVQLREIWKHRPVALFKRAV